MTCINIPDNVFDIIIASFLLGILLVLIVAAIIKCVIEKMASRRNRVSFEV